MYSRANDRVFATGKMRKKKLAHNNVRVNKLEVDKTDENLFAIVILWLLLFLWSAGRCPRASFSRLKRS